MKILVNGLWHLGLVTAACLSSKQNKVFAFDKNINLEKIKNNQLPIYEPGLDKLIKRNLEKKYIHFQSDLSFIDENIFDIYWHTADTQFDKNNNPLINEIIKEIKLIAHKLNDKCDIIISSQLPLGTTSKIEKYFKKNKIKNNVYYIPENLRLGSSIKYFKNPDRFIIGSRNKLKSKKISKILNQFTKNLVWIETEAAELTKHAINSFLANSISFINELSYLSYSHKIDFSEVEVGLKTDFRIGGKAYLKPGMPFYGGTLERDLYFLKNITKKHGLKAPLFNAILTSNNNHKRWLMHILKNLEKLIKFSDLAIWGIAYKKNTNTTRGSMIIDLIKNKYFNNFKINCFDPNIESLNINKKNIIFFDKHEFSLPKSKIIIIANDNDYFLKILKKMNTKTLGRLIIIDYSRLAFAIKDKFFKYMTIGFSK